MRLDLSRNQVRRPRGITLVEMVVAVALLVLMMTIIVTIFQSAIGSLQDYRTSMSIDQEQRRVDTVIRQDLMGVTAKMTPPNDPRENRGYFEYGENEFADAQGEDSDDTLRFTAQAPAGKPFVGRMWVPMTQADPTVKRQTLQPITATSQYAEIIYFLRNGRLYRRVLLIKPDFAGRLGVGNRPFDVPEQAPPAVPLAAFAFETNMFQPQALVSAVTGGAAPLVGWMALNDVSARPSAAPVPALNTITSYSPIPNTLADLTNRQNRAFNPRFANDYLDSGGNQLPDTVPDDSNGDGIPDWSPTLYPNLVLNNVTTTTGPLLWEPFPPARVGISLDTMAFPYIYPFSYSWPDRHRSLNGRGNVHTTDPAWNSPSVNPNLNHNPLDLGDSLSGPRRPQTWWGFPTWRETASPFWVDPIKRINDAAAAPFYTVPPGAAESPLTQARGLSAPTSAGVALPPVPSQLFNDGAGNPLFVMPPQAVWEDDLLATGVRSFDVKAYDPDPGYIENIDLNPAVHVRIPLPAGYYDLGYATIYNPQYLRGTAPASLGNMGHEGRMPPRVADGRVDPQYPIVRNPFTGIPDDRNIGDNAIDVIRLTRVWDSWSTDYMNAPALPIDPTTGPQSGMPPTYPSYPPPYPAPLRGIQIQIRMTDPNDQRTKTLTIRQDFTEKL